MKISSLLEKSFGVITASNCPLLASAIYKKITGPLLTIDVTINVERTIVKTEQKDKQK